MVSMEIRYNMPSDNWAKILLTLVLWRMNRMVKLVNFIAARAMPVQQITTPVVRFVVILLSIMKAIRSVRVFNNDLTVLNVCMASLLMASLNRMSHIPRIWMQKVRTEGRAKMPNAHNAWRLTVRWFVVFMMLKNRSVIKCYERALGIAISNVAYPRLASSVVESAVSLLHWTQKQFVSWVQ